MNRRRFLKFLGGTVGGLALAEAIPLGRVWSFPKKIVPANIAPLATIYYDRRAIEQFNNASRWLYTFEDESGKEIQPKILSPEGMNMESIRDWRSGNGLKIKLYPYEVRG